MLGGLKRKSDVTVRENRLRGNGMPKTTMGKKKVRKKRVRKRRVRKRRVRKKRIQMTKTTRTKPTRKILTETNSISPTMIGVPARPITILTRQCATVKSTQRDCLLVSKMSISTQIHRYHLLSLRCCSSITTRLMNFNHGSSPKTHSSLPAIQARS